MKFSSLVKVFSIEHNSKLWAFENPHGTRGRFVQQCFAVNVWTKIIGARTMLVTSPIGQREIPNVSGNSFYQLYCVIAMFLPLFAKTCGFNMTALQHIMQMLCAMVWLENLELNELDEVQKSSPSNVTILHIPYSSK